MGSTEASGVVVRISAKLRRISSRSSTTLPVSGEASVGRTEKASITRGSFDGQRR
jgi:hypothetical protein